METHETVGVEIHVSRMIQFALICCPACALNCSCTGYLPGALAIFHCPNCDLRYFVGLGPSPMLRVESTAPATAVA